MRRAQLPRAILGQATNAPHYVEVEAASGHRDRRRSRLRGLDRHRPRLLDLSGILPHEQVDVFNINTGGRFTTYAIEAPRGSRDVAVNGAAARLVQTGDKVIMVAYCQIPAEEARNYHPTVVVLGEGNEVKRAA
jgi:aspartate 1-decarboxylase